MQGKKRGNRVFAGSKGGGGGGLNPHYTPPPPHIRARDEVLYICHIFHVLYFCDFGLGQQIREGLISQVCDVFITLNYHVFKLTFLWGPTREIRNNKTTTKITTYIILTEWLVHLHCRRNWNYRGTWQLSSSIYACCLLSLYTSGGSRRECEGCRSYAVMLWDDSKRKNIEKQTIYEKGLLPLYMYIDLVSRQRHAQNSNFPYPEIIPIPKQKP